MLDLLITIIIISKRVNNHFLNELQEINESKNNSLEAIYLMVQILSFRSIKNSSRS